MSILKRKKTIIEVPEGYIEILEIRRNFIAEKFGWEIPDCIWEYFIELIKDCGIDLDNCAPSYLVDNIAVNSDWGYYDEYRKDGESDEELEERLEQESMCLFPEEKIVLMSL